VVYGLSTLKVMLRYALNRLRWLKADEFRLTLRQVISRHHAADILTDIADTV
jgi:hypothetical protein